MPCKLLYIFQGKVFLALPNTRGFGCLMLLLIGLALSLQPCIECTICLLQRLSLSTKVLNSRDRQGMYGMQHFRASKNKPYNKL